MRPFKVKLFGSIHAFELYDDDGAEITDLETAIDCAENQFGKGWEEVYNGAVGAERSECIGGKLCSFNVNIDTATYIGDGKNGAYYQTFQDGNGKWYVSVVVDSNGVDYLVKGDGWYETEEEAEDIGYDYARCWCINNNVKFCDEEGKERARAILEAERVLQTVGCGGPDCCTGSAWYDLVNESYAILSDNEKREFSDLHLLEDA